MTILAAVPTPSGDPVSPAYSGPMTMCPKCRNVGADTEWQPGHRHLNEWGRLQEQPGHPQAEPGWLLRTCGRCGYPWAETTEDARMEA